MPVIDMSRKIVGPDGKPLPREDGKAKPLTLAHVIFESLCASHPDDKPLSVDESYNRGKLACEIMNEPTAFSLTSDQVVLIKSLLTRKWLPFVVFQVVTILEGEPQKS